MTFFFFSTNIFIFFISIFKSCKFLAHYLLIIRMGHYQLVCLCGDPILSPRLGNPWGCVLLECSVADCGFFSQRMWHELLAQAVCCLSSCPHSVGIIQSVSGCQWSSQTVKFPKYILQYTSVKMINCLSDKMHCHKSILWRKKMHHCLIG